MTLHSNPSFSARSLRTVLAALGPSPVTPLKSRTQSFQVWQFILRWRKRIYNIVAGSSVCGSEKCHCLWQVYGEKNQSSKSKLISYTVPYRLACMPKISSLRRANQLMCGVELAASRSRGLLLSRRTSEVARYQGLLGKNM
jgi:hypothetical protein